METKSGFTFVELLVSLIILSIIMLILLQNMGMLNRVFVLNRKALLRAYAETNVENLFLIIEDELKYTGSLYFLLKNVDGMRVEDESYKIEGDSTITVSYAVAEKIILNRETCGENYYYYALFESEFPSTNTSGVNWTVQFNSLDDDETEVKLLKVEVYEGTNTTCGGNALIILDSNIKDVDDNPTTGLQFFIPVDYWELDKEIKIEGKNYYGERIATSTIYLNTENNTMIMKKYIPTIEKTYELWLMDNVISFEASQTDNNKITVILVYQLPGFPDEKDRIEKRRTFWIGGEGQ